MLIRLYSLLLILGFSNALYAQQVISKLEVKSNETYIVSQSNRLLIDTLIMHDKAKIKFEDGVNLSMAVNTAFVGKNCKILASGVNGSNKKTGVFGSDGEDGKNIELNIHFERLGSLIVDTRGGSGDKGEAGRGEVRSTKKTDADGSYTSLVPLVAARTGGKGGDGGNGGDVVLTYSTAGFIPRFNHKRGPNSIIFLYQGGKAGSTEARAKFEGKAGADGKVRLINASSGSIEQ